MKRICFINTAKIWGGGEIWQFETIKNYQSKADVVFIGNKQGKLIQQVEGYDVKTFGFNIQNLSFLNPFKLLKAYRLLKRIKADVVLLNASLDFKFFTVPAKLAGVPIILYRRDNGKRMKRHLLNKLLLQKGITHFVPCSNYIRDIAFSNNPNLFPKHKIDVIYNSIDIEQWDQKVIQPIIKKTKQFRFGIVGRLSDEKGIRLLPQIVNILKDKSADFEILVAGSGPLEQELKTEIQRLQLQEYFKLIGFTSDVKSVMKSIDCLILPSKWEGLPTVAIEALATNKPVVAFDVAGIPEVVRNGVSGFLVQPFDVDEFAKQMKFAIDHPAQLIELGVKGRNLVENTFSRKVTNQEFDKYFIN